MVTFHLWGVARHHVPWAMSRMMLHRRPLRRVPGLRFARLLGTGHGRTFTPRDADPQHWALLASWDTSGQAEAFDRGRLVGEWDARCEERWRLGMTPVSSKGSWSRQAPFGPATRDATTAAGPCAVLTRARLAPAKAFAFWDAVPPVAAAVADAPGLRFARGVGEAPIGLQATFSVWESQSAAARFAYHSPAHRAVIEQTSAAGWYAEQLFARFAVIEASGGVDGRDPLGMESGDGEREG
jgi:hypothetical protein